MQGQYKSSTTAPVLKTKSAMAVSNALHRLSESEVGKFFSIEDISHHLTHAGGNIQKAMASMEEAKAMMQSSLENVNKSQLVEDAVVAETTVSPSNAMGPPDEPVLQPPHSPPSSQSLYAILPKELKTVHGGWLLDPNACQFISESTDIGYKSDFVPEEREVLHGIDGIIDKKIPVHKVGHCRVLMRRPQKQINSKVKTAEGMVELENLADYYCRAAFCNCKIKVARVRFKDMSGLICYDAVDPTTNMPHKHQNHHFFKEEEKLMKNDNPLCRASGGGGSLFKPRPASASASAPAQTSGSTAHETGIKPSKKRKFTDVSLSVQQEETILKFGRGKMKRVRQQDIADYILDPRNHIRTSADQVKDPDKLLGAIEKFIENSKKAGNYFLNHDWGNEDMSGGHVKEVFDLLMQDDRSSDISISSDNTNSYLLSREFKELWKYIKVTEHDHDGSTWSTVAFEYLDVRELVNMAVTMFTDKKVQLEMDFFMGVCTEDEWQVGQIGFSDMDHRYWILCMVLSKSENHVSAGVLLKRATGVLNEAGGDGNYVLVDGGSALNKAINEENELRKTKALDDIDAVIAEEQHGATEEEAQHDVAAVGMNNSAADVDTAAAVAQDLSNVGGSEPINEQLVLDDIQYFLTGDEAGDDIVQPEDVFGEMLDIAEGESSLKDMFDAVLSTYKLGRRRCHAHILRMPGSRKGGWRGGNGSLPRQLISDGVPHKIMKKVSKALMKQL